MQCRCGIQTWPMEWTCAGITAQCSTVVCSTVAAFRHGVWNGRALASLHSAPQCYAVRHSDMAHAMDVRSLQSSVWWHTTSATTIPHHTTACAGAARQGATQYAGTARPIDHCTAPWSKTGRNFGLNTGAATLLLSCTVQGGRRVADNEWQLVIIMTDGGWRIMWWR
jgi:hypothetical protein